MATENLPFGLTLGGIALGIAVLLAGVLQNAGQSLNALMVAGGAILLAGVGVLVLWMLRLEPA